MTQIVPAEVFDFEFGKSAFPYTNDNVCRGVQGKPRI